MQINSSPSALFTMSPESPTIGNQLGDDSFQIQDPITGLFYIINFAWKCSMQKRLYAQMFFLKGDIHGAMQTRKDASL